ncbi:MAG: YciI family protein [Pseudorhodoplanes sp.]|uniref:YciI family protein n=1 Tax=Pseudorhodoplanes sp. TaxID=1934341 RepID=UPI003D09EEA5
MTHATPAASGAPTLQQQVAKLTSRMLRKKLFMVTYVSKVPANQLAALLPDHFEYMTTLARQGVLFAAGPIMHENGAPTGNGMALFNTASAAEARSLAEKDPFYLHGLRDFDVKEWIFMEGSMTVTLNFAECTLGMS